MYVLRHTQISNHYAIHQKQKCHVNDTSKKKKIKSPTLNMNPIPIFIKLQKIQNGNAAPRQQLLHKVLNILRAVSGHFHPNTECLSHNT